MSSQAPTLYPSLRCRDARAMIEFLESGFGFEELAVHAGDYGEIRHAELSYGPSILMLGGERDDLYGRRAGQSWLYVAVEDPDAHCERARAAGAEIVVELHDTDYGSRDYAARDPEGNMWNFGTYRPAADGVTPRRPGRPARLSQDAVVAAARAIVERDGIDALTMRAVAQEAGGSTMSIYRHVRDKDELLVLLLDQLARELPPPRLPRDPRARLLAACRAMRDGLAEHPWIVDVLAGGDLIAPSILWLMEEIVAGFVACGLSHAQAADAYRAVWQFTVGELMVRRGLDRMATLDRPPFVVEVLTGVDPDELPTLAALAEHWAPARGRGSYEPGLRALVDGLLTR